MNNAAETVLLRHQNLTLKGQLDAAYGFEGIIGETQAIRQVISTIRRVAPTPISVLVTGESGTGKELVAATIHRHSRRKDKRYVTFNAAGQSETLLEDQLFGHVRGAFTGAERDREGVFQYADGGTLFLDEIGDMPLPMQAKLLRVLETGEIVRLGSNETRKTDVRFASELERTRPTVTEPAMLRLVAYPWPGNVRELLNVVQRLVVMDDSDTIDVRHIPEEIRTDDADDGAGIGSLAGVGLDRLEKEAIRQTLAMAGGNREQAARLLGIGERTLYRKLKEFGLK